LTPRASSAYSPPVFRFPHLAAAALLSLPLIAAQPPSPLVPPPPPSPPAMSMIYVSQDPNAVVLLEENPVVTRHMVDRVVRAATGQADTASAWRTLVEPTDRVGIKIAAAGGHYFASHHGIVDAILAGLEEAGVPRNHVVVWDREADDLRAAGYTADHGYQLASIPPSKGYDRSAQFSAPILGKLIWGDTLFAEKQGKLGKRFSESDQLSSSSFLANVLSKGVTKVINVPVLSDEAGCGVAGAIYNMTVPNLDNWRRFVQTEGDGGSGLLDIYADERIGGKVVLTIMDALLAQYAGGPRFNANYAYPYRTIYASKDALALDANAFRLIEGWRKEAKLPSIAGRAEWLQLGEQMGIGHYAENKIILRSVGTE